MGILLYDIKPRNKHEAQFGHVGVRTVSLRLGKDTETVALFRVETWVRVQLARDVLLGDRRDGWVDICPVALSK